jgi:beta propeller repeat protein
MSRSRWWWLAIAGALVACEREVIVEMANDGFTVAPPIGGAGGVAGVVASSGSQGGVGASGASNAGAGGVALPTGGMDASGSGGREPRGGEGASGAPSPSGLLGAIDQAQPGALALLESFELLSERLTSIERPAVASDGVSLVQYDRSGNASILHVSWDGQAQTWHGSSGAYFAYTAAVLDRHFSLLHAESYPIFAGGGGAELSGDASAFKEFLAASAVGVAWFDYPTPVVSTPGLQSFGELALQRDDGTRAVLSDRSRYRARLALSATHAAFVEYESSAPGSIGQVIALPLSGAPGFAVAPSAVHQDRPALDGDWLVLEEYRSASDAVIRAYNLTTGELRDVSPTADFRTNADVLGTRVVWEDYRDGSADIYLFDLATGEEHPLVTGAGHSAAPRLTGDGVVWIEAQGNKAALARARFRASSL